MKHRITALIVSFLLAVSAAGCSLAEEKIQENAQEKAEQAAQEIIEQGKEKEDAEPERRKLKAAVLYDTLTDAKTMAIADHLRKELKALDVKTTEYEAEGDFDLQLQQTAAAIEEGSDVLMVELADEGYSNEAEAICRAAADHGIPVIFFYKEIELRNEQGLILDHFDNTAFVGPSVRAAGRVQGEMIGEYVRDHYRDVDLNGDGRISYALFKGDNLSEKADLRTRTSVENASGVLTEAGYPALTYFDEGNSYGYQLDLTETWSAFSVRDYMETNLALYNEEKGNMIELVICNSDQMAEGAVAALNDAGYNLGDGESTAIPVFGIDGTYKGRELIQGRKMTGTAVCDAGKIAQKMAALADNLCLGKELTGDSGTRRFTVDYDKVLVKEEKKEE
ncbi:MAG: substrate-binding domain-containing protein [Lachnospiraceae bacterium]|nr:substrate-binding domain-containing protein [Lachnospiraceae bacterium]MBQ5360005.1 substrate-binding domain-containing protein [Lachnospiraceae bacterium]